MSYVKTVWDTGDTITAAKLNNLEEGVELFTVPSGGIIMWSGSIASIPTGWLLCDGSSGTPDLRNRFVVGAGSTYSVASVGGANTVSLSVSELPSHVHSPGSLATASAGDHSHTTPVPATATTRDTGSFSTVTSATTNVASSTAGAHTHSLTGTTAAAGSGTAHENRPPYYALAFIMKA
jgi:microcystin-dependent protein